MTITSHDLPLIAAYEDWKSIASKQAIKRLTKQAEKLGVENYIYFSQRQANLELPNWAIDLSKNQRSKVRKIAKELQVSELEAKNILAKRREENKPQVDSKKADRKAMKSELRQLAKEINENQTRFDSSNVELITWDSEEMSKLMSEDESYKLAKGITLGLMRGRDTLRHQTFNNLKEGEIVDKSLSIAMSTNEELNQAEKKFSKKVGDLRCLPFKEWVSNVVDLWKNVEFNPNHRILAQAINNVKSEIEDLLILLEGESFIFPLNIEEAYNKVTKGRNSGYPYYTSKWAESEEIVEYYKLEALKLLNGKKLTAPRILFKRVQNNGESVKMRPVECPPKSEAIAAKVFTDKLVSAFKLSDKFCGFNGNTQIDSQMREVFKYKYLLSSDFSKFDCTAQNFIPIVFDMMKELTPKHYETYFDNLKEYYQYSELITPIGILKGKPGVKNGLQSGDGWTSVIGTITNAIANEYFKISTGNFNAKVLSFGDDCVFASNKPIDVALYSKIMQEIGMICNPEKQELSENYFSFLGYLYFRKDLNKKDGELHIFPITRCLTKLIYQETSLNYDSIVKEAMLEGLQGDELISVLNANKKGLDLLSHLQKLENCKNHPKFEQFVNFFREHEPNKMKTELIKPLAPLKDYIKTNRRNRKDGVINSATFKLIEMFEIIETKSLI